MAFVVEDGTGLSTANSYVALQAFKDHHADRETDVTGFTDPSIQGALVKATDYVDKRFGPRFRGFKESKAQALEWPRLSAFDNDDFLMSGDDRVPRQLQKAILEYGLLSLQIGALLPIPARPFSTIDPVTGKTVSGISGQVQRLREKVGPIEEETWYQNTAQIISRSKPGGSSVVSDFNLPEYPVADEWLRELLKPDFTVELRRA